MAMATAQQVPEVPASDVPAEGWLLDVREPYEWMAGHAPSARHIPMAELSRRAGEIPSDDTIYVICRSGNRSARVTLALSEAGWRAINVAGGMHDWEAAGRPMVSESGAPPAVA
jgi:rhodanese-related sulfurtransferase